MDIINQYLDLVKRSLMGSLNTAFPEDWQFSLMADDKLFWQSLTDGSIRTMLGNEKIDNIRFCVQQVVKNKVDGDFIEAGCWRGGGIVYMKACLTAYESVYESKSNRVVIAADLFPGKSTLAQKQWLRFLLKLGCHVNGILPNYIKQKIATYLLESFPKEEYSTQTLTKIMYLGKKLPWFKSFKLADTSSDDLKEALKRYQLLDDRIILKAGWFEETFPTIISNKLAILRIDADFYSSTKKTLETFYNRLSANGYCIIDDYFGFEECRKAVDEFRTKHNITNTVTNIDGIGIYWKK